MKSIWNLLIVVIILFSTSIGFGQSNRDKNVFNKDVANLLTKVFESDQKYRKEISGVLKKHGRDSNEFKKHLGKMQKADAENLEKVKQILDTHGWLGVDEIGSLGSMTLFLVIQHADAEVRTQEKYYPMLKKAVQEKKANSAHLAMLTDRIAVNRGRFQTYGSQLEKDADSETYHVYPLKNPEKVNQRRAEVGLQPMAEYLKFWDLKWDANQYVKNLPTLLKKRDEQRLKNKTGWILLYSNDKDGNTTKGLKQNLLNAVRNGCEVRIGWGIYGEVPVGDKKKIFAVEHTADTNFLTISKGEVFAQIKSIMAQAPAFEEANISLIQTTQWNAIFSTTGKLNQIFLNEDPKKTQKMSSKNNMHWYVNAEACNYEKSDLKHLY